MRTSPRLFGGPPNERASEQNEHGQYEPRQKVGVEDISAERKNRHDCSKIVRSGVTAVRAAAPPCIQEAGRSHPDQRHHPDHGSKRLRKEEADQDGTLWNPPRQRTRGGASQPIARYIDIEPV